MSEQEYSIERDGIPNLDFTGNLIGSSGGPAPQFRIYRTKAGKYIGEMRVDAKRSNTSHVDKPSDLIAWLRTEVGGPITPAAQDAVEEAAKSDDAFRAAWNEHVD